MKSKNLTIMFTDIKGFVNLTSGYSRKKMDNLIDLQDEVVLPIIKDKGGRANRTS